MSRQRLSSSISIADAGRQKENMPLNLAVEYRWFDASCGLHERTTGSNGNLFKFQEQISRPEHSEEPSAQKGSLKSDEHGSPQLVLADQSLPDDALNVIPTKPQAPNACGEKHRDCGLIEEVGNSCTAATEQIDRSNRHDNLWAMKTNFCSEDKEVKLCDALVEKVGETMRVQFPIHITT